MSDEPLEPTPRVVEIVREGQAAAGPNGHTVFKWTCVKCGQRVAFLQLDTVYTRAEHDEPWCGGITDINTLEADLGYMLILTVPTDDLGTAGEALRQAFTRRDGVRARRN